MAADPTAPTLPSRTACRALRITTSARDPRDSVEGRVVEAVVGVGAAVQRVDMVAITTRAM